MLFMMFTGTNLAIEFPNNVEEKDGTKKFKTRNLEKEYDPK